MCVWACRRGQADPINCWIRGVGDRENQPISPPPLHPRGPVPHWLPSPLPPRRPIPPLPPKGLVLGKESQPVPEIAIIPPSPRESLDLLASEQGEGESGFDETNTQVLPPIMSLEDSQDIIFGLNDSAESDTIQPNESHGGDELLQEGDVDELGDGQPPPIDPFVEVLPLWERDWGIEYEKCPRWSSQWCEIRDGPWPAEFQVFNDRLYYKDKLCVPTSLLDSLIRDHHEFLGHVGGFKLWKHMENRYFWADSVEAKTHTLRVQHFCEICQACQRPRVLDGLMRSTPIPSAPMVSFAIDLFSLPSVLFESKRYDTLAVCVDRHSG